MLVLGISSNYHDASAALVEDGIVVASAAEERFTLQKHDSTFPIHAIDFCLRQRQIKPKDLTLVVYHENPSIKLSRTIAASLANFPLSFPVFFKSAYEAITHNIWIRKEISDCLECDPAKIKFIPHHLSHAAHAFLGSPFKNSAILTLDAIGEWSSSGIFLGNKEGGNSPIEPLHIIPFPHSLGLFYSAVTAYLGFKVNDGECNTMALAAFGKPRFQDAFRKVLIDQSEDGFYQLNLNYFRFSSDEEVPVSDLFLKTFGPARNFKVALPFDSFQTVPADPESQRFADIAASAQLVLEEKILKIVARTKELTKTNSLCLSGGVALNCVANGKILKSKVFENIFIPPDPGDGGGAMGAALLGSAWQKKSVAEGLRLSPYLGESHSNQELDDLLNTKEIAQKIRMVSESELGSAGTIAFLATKLAEGKIVGWFNGRFENGPRALGNRSIIIDPENISVARRLSSLVKKRAAFRPYACSITEESAKLIFEIADPDFSFVGIRWMQFALEVRKEWQTKIRAALHIDGTTRPHICTKEENPLFYDLLQTFGKQKGLSALLNTSFNPPGLPLVSNPLEAFLMFYQTDMDLLFINGKIFKKHCT